MAKERFERQALARPGELASLRRAVWEHAEELGARPDLRDPIRLAVGEALTNVVMHAYVGMPTGTIRLEAWVDEDGRFSVLVLDEGRGPVPRADSPGLGFGLGLMAQLADELRISTREGTPGTAVLLKFSLQRRSGDERGRYWATNA